jgi:hypothetical protein
MYFTRFGYFVIFSIIAVAAAAVVLIIWPFGEDANGGDSTTRPTATAAATAPPTATTEPLPALDFEQVANFAKGGAVVRIVVTGGQIIVELNPAFDVSGLNTTSHTFTTTLPPGANSVEEALTAEGVAVGGDDGVQVVRQ